MTESASSVLAPWANFYVMTGSSAAALTGLMFVVITLVTGVERTSRNPNGISTFSTPTVVHFSAALLGSAILSAPWHILWHPAVLLALGSLYGIGYVLRVMNLTRHLTEYKPDLEDWLWFNVLPFIAYGAILAGAILLLIVPVTAMFATASGVLFLILLGIRNAWDVVTFLAIQRDDDPKNST